jgi:hypothetical protein
VLGVVTFKIGRAGLQAGAGEHNLALVKPRNGLLICFRNASDRQEEENQQSQNEQSKSPNNDRLQQRRRKSCDGKEGRANKGQPKRNPHRPALPLQQRNDPKSAQTQKDEHPYPQQDSAQAWYQHSVPFTADCQTAIIMYQNIAFEIEIRSKSANIAFSGGLY